MSHKGQESVKCIHPYMHEMQWVFDDPAVGLDKEPFVNGADLLIDQLVEHIPNAEYGFALLFSAAPFEGSSVKLVWEREEADGNWYYCDAFNTSGWLCPALLKYFGTAPGEIYVGAKSLGMVDAKGKESRASKMVAQYGKKLEAAPKNIIPKEPSVFYEQFKNAKPFLVSYPVDVEGSGTDGSGPYWLPSGELDLERSQEWVEEQVDVLELGDNKYQIAEAPDLFTDLRLRWGDVFYADREGRKLKLLKVEMPMRYKHYSSVGGAFSNESPLAELVHRLGGGWGTVAMGFLTITIPANRAEEYETAIGSKPKR